MYRDKKKMTEVFAFMYTHCIYESAMATMSLHLTKKGAYKAMNKFLNDRFNVEREEHIRCKKYSIFDHVFEHEAWEIKPIDLKE